MARSLLQRRSMRAAKNCLVYIVGLALASSLVACLGDDDGGGIVRIPADDPAIDADLDLRDVVCESTLTVTGTFTLNTARPLGEGGISGCWADGTWSVTPTLQRTGCSPQAQPPQFEYLAEYIELDEMRGIEDTTIVSFPAEPNNQRLNLGITANGDGCIGIFEHYGTDNSVWSFHVNLGETPDDMAVGATMELNGDGTYSVYEYDQFCSPGSTEPECQ